MLTVVDDNDAFRYFKRLSLTEKILLGIAAAGYVIAMILAVVLR